MTMQLFAAAQTKTSQRALFNGDAIGVLLPGHWYLLTINAI